MYKVLIIDDDKLERKGLISIVPWESLGLTVAGDVANSMLALEFLESHEVNLAVVDISMPVLSGLDFIRENRKRRPGLSYVVLSFHEDFAYIQQALRLGALDYISKLRPEEEDCIEIFRRIAQLMGLSREQADAAAPEPPTEDGRSLPEAKLGAARALWCGLLWVYDEERFGEQLPELADSGIGLRQLERMLMWVSQEVERSFGVWCSQPYLADRQEETRWLETLYGHLQSREKGAGDPSLLPACILGAVRYIRDHLTERLKAGEVAHQVNMSRSYFSTSFKGVTGYTFNDYLRYERVELAAGLNMGIAGIPWWTIDIGGFHGGDINDPAFRECLIHWFQFGAFCPVMRLHGDREPHKKLLGTTGGALPAARKTRSGPTARRPMKSSADTCACGRKCAPTSPPP